MAHFAKTENGKVINVIVVKNENAPNEEAGQAFIASLGMDGEWLQTSYNKNFRGQYAGIGMSYDSTLDCFHGESPYPSWTLASDGQHHAPTDKPEGAHKWDEETLSWIEIV